MVIGTTLLSHSFFFFARQPACNSLGQANSKHLCDNTEGPEVKLIYTKVPVMISTFPVSRNPKSPSTESNCFYRFEVNASYAPYLKHGNETQVPCTNGVSYLNT